MASSDLLSKQDQSNVSLYVQRTHTLPSGIRVRMVVADPRRPWEVHGAADNCVVRRARRGDSSSFEYFRAGRPVPLVLNEADAAAVVALLNSNSPKRVPRPTRWSP